MLPLNRDPMAVICSCILISRSACKDTCGGNSDAGQPLSHQPCDSLSANVLLCRSHIHCFSCSP